MALTTSINQDSCGDAWNNPQNVDHIDIIRTDGTRETYYCDDDGWYTIVDATHDRAMSYRDMTHALIAAVARGDRSNVRIALA